ncbi:MAG: outer membrane lipoprotein carrier protein LolA [Planctomycetota bacterium]|nr:outer membrane lipoprotein carrier protein LolA [Planctomycetota bacterium]
MSLEKLVAARHPARYAFALLSAAIFSLVAMPVSALQVTEAGSDTALIPADAPTLDAHALLEAFAEVQGLQANFEETKFLTLLSVPLKSSGKFYFFAPGILLRQVEKPESSALLIQPGELRMSHAGGTETIDLRQSDALRLFVTSLLQVFAGDEKHLADNYKIDFQVAADSATWTLTLTPKAEPLTAMIRQLMLSGEEFTVETIEVWEPNGDRSVTRLTDVDAQRVFTAEEQLELFGIRSD